MNWIFEHITKPFLNGLIMGLLLILSVIVISWIHYNFTHNNFTHKTKEIKATKVDTSKFVSCIVTQAKNGSELNSIIEIPSTENKCVIREILHAPVYFETHGRQEITFYGEDSK